MYDDGKQFRNQFKAFIYKKKCVNPFSKLKKKKQGKLTAEL